MVTFRNNNINSRRSNFRRNDRSFKSNSDRQKFSPNFTGNDNFKRKSPGRNNHNASKLIEKYSNSARYIRQHAGQDNRQYRKNTQLIRHRKDSRR